MTKRQAPDLSKLLAATAAPMVDAAEPSSAPLAVAQAPPAGLASKSRQVSGTAGDEAATVNLENLNFKVPRSFRKRFRDCAYKADLKHNELLFAALDAWETLNGNKN